MTEIAIIGGTGLRTLSGLDVTREQVKETPYGKPSGPFVFGRFRDKELVFLGRHGPEHTIPPHQINYRANIWALRDIGVKRIISVAAVGGISEEMAPSRLAFPDQIIDYTWGRSHTFFDGGQTAVMHVDFTDPYCTELRALLIRAAADGDIDTFNHGAYAATQGPRLESAAEIARLERDGCSMVGMTGMPEAVLARELELSYAACAVVANWAAGRGDSGDEITMEAIEANLKTAMDRVKKLLTLAIPLL